MSQSAHNVWKDTESVSQDRNGLDPTDAKIRIVFHIGGKSEIRQIKLGKLIIERLYNH